eukprot:scaffold12086_cov67-Phaeocystis_antarctica.AAC.5
MAWAYGYMHAPWPRVRRAPPRAARSPAAPPPPPSPLRPPARPPHARARRAPPPRPPRIPPPASPPPRPPPPRGSWPSARSLSRSRAAAPRAPPRLPPRSPRRAPSWADRPRSMHTDAHRCTNAPAPPSSHSHSACMVPGILMSIVGGTL